MAEGESIEIYPKNELELKDKGEQIHIKFLFNFINLKPQVNRWNAQFAYKHAYTPHNYLAGTYSASSASKV